MHLPGHNSALDVARATLQAVEKLSTLVPAFEDELNHLISMTQSIITTVGGHRLNRSSNEDLAKTTCDTLHILVVAASDPRMCDCPETRKDVEDLTAMIQSVKVHIEIHFQRRRHERLITYLNSEDAKTNDSLCNELNMAAKSFHFSHDVISYLNVSTKKAILSVSHSRLNDALIQIGNDLGCSLNPLTLTKLRDDLDSQEPFSRKPTGNRGMLPKQMDRSQNVSTWTTKSTSQRRGYSPPQRVFTDIPQTEEPESYLPPTSVTPTFINAPVRHVQNVQHVSDEPPSWFRPPQWTRSTTYSTHCSSDSPTEESIPETPVVGNPPDPSIRVAFPSVMFYSEDSLDSFHAGTFIRPFSSQPPVQEGGKQPQPVCT